MASSLKRDAHLPAPWLAGMALSDVVLMRVVHGAPELPVPGQLVSPSG